MELPENKAKTPGSGTASNQTMSNEEEVRIPMPIDSNQSSHGNFTKSGINDTQKAIMPEIQAINSSSTKVVTMSNQRVSADVSKFNDPKHHHG